MDMIKVSGLSFRYIEEWILKDISFSVKKGEFLGIIGPNGSGKTTLLKNLNRTLNPEQGSVFINEANIRDVKRKKLSMIVGMVPQEASIIFPFTVMEVVLMGRAPYLGRLSFEREKDYKIAKEAMEMTNTLCFSPRDISTLSGGEKQRVFIARAIAQEPDIMLLDEPTSFLDIKHQVETYDLIKQLNSGSGLTIVSISHDINLAAQYCDRILILNNGKIHSIGCPEEVITREDIEVVYDCQVLVDRNPITNKPRITPMGKNI